MNHARGGLLLYDDDANFIRPDLFTVNGTRQIEFIKAETSQAAGYPSWGGTSLGPPAIGNSVTAWLRIIKRNVNGEEHYTAYSNKGGSTWTQGGTWVHSLGKSPKICFYAGNRAGFAATFHYIHVFHRAVSLTLRTQEERKLIAWVL